MTVVVCRGCGWASWPVSRAYAERSVARFNAYLAAADDETRAVYGGRSASLDPVVCEALADDAPGQEQ